MAYLNINNMCNFEGRLVKDPEVSSVQMGGKAVTKCKFTVAVDKMMTKEQKEKASQSGEPTADFINFDAIGPKADFVGKWFKKGSGIKVVASFRTFSYEKDGKKVYGSSFDVVDAGFTIGGVQGGTGNPDSQKGNGFQALTDADIPF